MADRGWGGGDRGAGRKLTSIEGRPICCGVLAGSWGQRWRCRGACKRFIKKEVAG